MIKVDLCWYWYFCWGTPFIWEEIHMIGLLKELHQFIWVQIWKCHKWTKVIGYNYELIMQHLLMYFRIIQCLGDTLTFLSFFQFHFAKIAYWICHHLSNPKWQIKTKATKQCLILSWLGNIYLYWWSRTYIMIKNTLILIWTLTYQLSMISTLLIILLFKRSQLIVLIPVLKEKFTLSSSAMLP